MCTWDQGQDGQTPFQDASGASDLTLALSVLEAIELIN